MTVNSICCTDCGKMFDPRKEGYYDEQKLTSFCQECGDKY